MRKLLAGLLSGAIIFGAGLAQAESLKLSGNKHWLLVASTKDLDTAIGIARQFQSHAPEVVNSESGYYGIILGPYEGASIEAIKKKDENFPDVPKDALLSDGSRYTGVAWKAPADVSALVDYEVDKPVQLSAGDLAVEAKLEKAKDDAYATVVSGSEKSGLGFTFKVGEDGEYINMQSQVGLIKLDPKLSVPQIMLTRNAGGAHCCVNTWIVEKPNGAGGWSLIDTGKLDGGGYWFEDVDGDGGLELLSVDNRFLYAFDSYAGSFAPLMIAKLREGRVADVTDDPTMKSRLKQDLAGMEFQAKINPDLWKSNGFLAAWAASKMRLGEGDAAWPVIVKNMASNSGFGPQECSTGQKFEDCPVDKLKDIPILKGLANFLKENGYGPLPADAEKLLR